MIVYVNGDSYSVTSDGKKYSDFLAELYGCSAINAGIRGSCNDRIFRTSLRDLMSLKEQHDEIAVAISLSFIMRTELWDPDIIDNRFENDGEFVSIQPTHAVNWFEHKKSTLPELYNSYGTSWLRWYNVEAETVKLLKEILLFTTWCKYNKIKYVIFSSALQEPVDFNSTFIKSFYDTITADKNIINIFESSFTEWNLSRGHKPITQITQSVYGKTYNIGHHGEKAHQDFANFLFKNYLGIQ